MESSIVRHEEGQTTSYQTVLSIIIPTYNESQSITRLIDSIISNLPNGLRTEILIVDDNSPDGTGKIAKEHATTLTNNATCSVVVVSRSSKSGLSSAILAGIHASKGQNIVIMDGDFSHPPHIIPQMLDELSKPSCDVVIGSRYVIGGSIIGWPFKRKVISKGATKIARHGLGIKGVKDPMSGFFAFKRHVAEGIKFDAIGYKMLLEILVKAKGTRVVEIPYTFTNRKVGSSKLSTSVIIDYLKAVWRLYRYGAALKEKEGRRSVRFLSKAARFYTVGASGLLINYIVSLFFESVMPNLWYLHASIFGIIASMTSNFFLNKWWTFEDMDFSKRKTLTQYGLFLGFSTAGALVQLAMLFLLVETYGIDYPLALIAAVAIAAVGNFLLNKKWTFKEKFWG